MVAMALSGYTDEKSSLWREMCSSLRLQLKNPYLCVMFAFLTSEPGAYDGVLVMDLLLSWNLVALLQTQGKLVYEKIDGEIGREIVNTSGALEEMCFTFM